MASRINLPERETLFKLLAQKIPIVEIAKFLNRHRSTIYKEINRIPCAYSPSVAQNDANLKSMNSKKNIKLQNEELQKFVKTKIFEYWSPEQISGRLKLLYPNDQKMKVSTEAIYQFIYNLENDVEKINLITHLRRKKKKRHSRKNKNEKRGKIPNIKSIHERPKSVETRNDLGHWEGDLIIGKDHKSAIGTLVERKTRFTIIVSLPNGKKSETVVNAFIDEFKQLPLGLKKSLTYDRGTEMSYHSRLTTQTGVIVYFADPHSPWQRGSNENTNGLIRSFFPKGTDFSNYSKKAFEKAQNFLNNRPRKVLKYLTPNEFLQRHKIKLKSKHQYC